MLKALPATWGDPPYELKRRKGATPLAKGPRHMSVMALPTLPGSLDMTVVVFSVWWLLQSVDFIYHKNIHLGAGYKLQAN